MQNKEVQALITPTDKAIAGDHVHERFGPPPAGESASNHLSRHRDDLHHVGNRGRRHHRRRIAVDGRGGRQDRLAMGLGHRYRGRPASPKNTVSAVAVDHVSFTVGALGNFGLLGPNGAGKTTTILMLLGLTYISDGEVSVLGFDPVRQPLSVKRRVGYMPDTVGFYDELDGRRQFALHRAPDWLSRKSIARKGSRMRSIGSASPRFADKPVSIFSRGMRQRLGLGPKILMKGAQIAILDEPTSGVDPHDDGGKVAFHHPRFQGRGGF